MILNRAKTIRQDFTEETIGLKFIDGEWYAIGNYVPDIVNLKHLMFWSGIKGLNSYEIDISTLAINLPNTIDSEDKYIFASLSTDGKGGDKELFGRTFIFKNKLKLIARDGTKWDYKSEKKQIKITVIGIQK